MFVWFKKVDSVTGILLFLFNAFLMEQGITTVPLKKIFRLMEPFNKNETTIRMGLSRGVKKGLLVNYKQDGEVYYRITDEVIEGLKYWQTTLKRFQNRVREQLAEWDGRWSIVVIKLADDKDQDKIACFSDALSQMGYGKLSRSLWICPRERSETVSGLVGEYRLEKAVHIFTGQLVEKEKAAVIASDIWSISSLAEKYRSYLDRLVEAAKGIDIQSDIESCLPFLHAYGFEIFEIIQEDPQLPLSLLPPDWPGLKATKTFFELRTRIMTVAGDYVKGILNSG